MPDHGAALRQVASFLARSLAGGDPSSPAVAAAAAAPGAFPVAPASAAPASSLPAPHGEPAASGPVFQHEVLAVGHRVVHGGGIAHSVLVE